MSSPLSELSEPPGSPEPFELPPAIEEAAQPAEIIEVEDVPPVSFPVGAQHEENQLDHPAQAEISNENLDLFGDNDNSNEENELIIVDRSPVAEGPIDLSHESPELIHQSGNVVQVRWAGTEGEEDLVIEVDENGYEIPKDTEVFTSEQQRVEDVESTEDGLQVDGERGVRSLLDICRGSEFMIPFFVLHSLTVIPFSRDALCLTLRRHRRLTVSATSAILQFLVCQAARATGGEFASKSYRPD